MTAYSDDEEDARLNSLGYKKSLTRGLTQLANFGFGFTEVGILVSISMLYGQALEAGGPSVLLWGFIVSYAMFTVTVYCMAEICSAYPCAGSVYHWSSLVTPERYAPLASYICGWSNFIGNAAGDASFAYGFASLLNAAIEASGGQEYDSYGVVAVSIAVIFLWSFLCYFEIEKLGAVVNGASLIQMSSILIIIISLFASASSLNSSSFVFTEFNNDTGFTDKSYVVVVGLVVSLYAFSGFECSAHMAEETVSSSVSAPNGMINTVLASGVGGLIYRFAVLYTTNIDSALATDDSNGFTLTDTASINVFIQTCGQSYGAGLAWLIVVNIFFAGLSSVAVTGRITFALMRDDAFPYSEYLMQVDADTKSPIRAIFFVFIFDALLLLLPLNSNSGVTAFESIVGLCTLGFQISYGLPILLKLYFNTTLPDAPLSLGEWSRPMGLVSVIWLFGTSSFFFLQSEYPVTASNFNYLVAVVAAVVLICALYWNLQGHKTFRGPNRGKSVDSSRAGESYTSQAGLISGIYQS